LKFRYVLHENPKKEKNSGNGGAAKSKSSESLSLAETVRDNKIGWLAKKDFKSEEALKVKRKFYLL